MSQVNNSKWLELLAEVEELTHKNNEITKEYVDVVLSRNKIIKSNKIKNYVISLLAAFIIIFGINIYSKNRFLIQKQKPEELQNSFTKKPPYLDTKSDVPKTVFSVQIAALKKLKIDNTSNLSSNFKTLKNEDKLNIYSIGEFYTFKHADDFKKQLQKLGFKDAFVILVSNHKKAALKDSLSLSP